MTLIHTNRFVLRPIEATDAPVFAHLCNDPLIARNTARIPHPYTLDDADEFCKAIARAFALGTEYVFAVCDNEDIIACCGVMRVTNEIFDLGHWVAEHARGKGVAAEAAHAVASFAFERLQAKTLLAGHYTDNPASGRVLEKTGFRKTGEIRKQFSVGRGGEADSARVRLDKADFIAPEAVQFMES